LANVPLAGHLFPSLPHPSHPLQLDGVDLEEDAARPSGRADTDLCVVVWSGLILRLWILPLHRLALAGEAGTGGDQSSGLVRKILPGPSNRGGLGLASGGPVGFAARARSARHFRLAELAGLAPIASGLATSLWRIDFAIENGATLHSTSPLAVGDTFFLAGHSTPRKTN
jgi:hypothetical protein